MQHKTTHQRKRIMILLTLLFIAVGMTKTYAQSFSVGDLNYSVNSDSVSVTVTGHVNGTSATGSLIIPEVVTYEGTTYSVTTIQYFAFYGCSGFTGDLIIPNSITSIGYSAFSGCNGFTGVFIDDISHWCSISFGDSGSNPLSTAHNLYVNNVLVTDLVIPETVTMLNAYAFSGATCFTSLTIPNSVTSIGDGVFWGCSNMTGDLVVPNSVTSIGQNAFYNCSGFTGNLTISNSVTSIGSMAFHNCSGLTGSLTIPNSVTSIGSMAFHNCSSIMEVHYYATNCADADSYSPPFQGCGGILDIGDNVENIPANMFSGGGFTGSLTIPSTVTSIGDRAFDNCTGFSEVHYNVTNCANTTGHAFGGCGGALFIGDNVESIPEYLFSGGSFTGDLIIPNSVISIGSSAFYGCNGFTGSLIIPNSVTSIGEYAFYNCSGFGEVQYNVTNCTNVYASFLGCGGSLIIGDNVECLPDNIFNGGGFTGNLTIPSSVTSIGFEAFSGCSGFTGSLTIPDSVTSIGLYAFSGCSGFNEVHYNVVNCESYGRVFQGCSGSLIIGGNVENIPANMFEGSGFTGDLTIPNSVVSIGSGAFDGCNGFSGSLTIPYSVISIGNNAFKNCTGFTEVLYNATNCANANSNYPPFQGCGGSLIIGDNVESIPAYMFKGGSFTGELIIPNSVLSIGNHAFNNCSGVSGVYYNATNCANANSSYPPFQGCGGFLTIGEDVESIPKYIFKSGGFTAVNFNAINCADFSYSYYSPFQGYGGTFTVGDDVERIPAFLLYNCSGFTGSLTVGNSVTSIGYDAFYNCSGFTGNLTIGNSMTSIGYNAFYNCSGFSSITSFAEVPPFVDYEAFYDVNHDIPIIVPCGRMSVYQNASGWNEFTNYQEDCTTTISDEICYGEDYFQNGFEIYYPEIGENQYSITLPSSQNTDSIVNLTLTVHPTYFFVEDTTLCNTSSFEWHGKTYTESGIYYDSLQTIHSCDSIFQLSLELFNTLMGDFTYMSPTDNYPFTSLPITFNWDAVPDAEYYDLYVWDADESMPEEPFASNLRYGNYSTSAFQNYHTYNWYVKARNACNEASSSVKSFYLDITPSLNVNVNHINFGEVAMNQSTSTTLSVTGIVLEDALDVQITGDDAAMFSFTQASGWNNYNGGILIVTFSPTTPQYTYSANLVVSSGTFTETITLIGAVSNLFTFNTYVAEGVYAMNSQIPVYGSVTDWNNAPVADAEVEIGVFVMGMKRTLQAMTDTNGQFSAVFEPMPSESGYYTVNSGRLGNQSTEVHDGFNIPGMAVVANDYILCAVTQDQPRTDSILIRNKSNLPLSNIQLSTLSAPVGCSFNSSPINLGGLEEDYLVYTVTGSTLTQGNYYEEVRLKATSDEGAETIITIWYYCMEPRGLLDVIPQSIATTMTKGKSKIVDVMLTNNGTGATGNITIDLPDVDWMSVVGNDTLPSLAVNDTAYFSLRFSPDNDLPLVQYSGTIAINSERGDAIGLPYTITAVSDSTGMLVINVTDDYTWNTNNGNGPHLEGAEVTLKGYYSLETVAQGYTDVNGIFQVENLPEGYYRLHVEADRHTQYDNIILITAGETNNQDIYLQYQAVTYSWKVEPTEIEDEYTYELIVEYETNVPVPVITIEHSGIHVLEYGESANFNLVITNHGLIEAYDTHIYFTESDYTFIPLIDHIDTLAALTTIVVPGTYYRNNNRAKSGDDCDAHCLTVSVYYCNANGGWSPLINRSLPFWFNICDYISSGDGGDGGRIPGFNTPFGGPFGIITEEHNNSAKVEKEFCEPCINALVNVLAGLLESVLDLNAPACMIFHALTDGGLAAIMGSFDIFKLLAAEANCLGALPFGALYDIASTLESIFSLGTCVRVDLGFNGTSGSKNNVDNIHNTIDELFYSSQYLYNEITFIKSIFVEDAWDNEGNILGFINELNALINPEDNLIAETDAIYLASSFIGTSVAYDDIINLVNRWNRSVEYWSDGYYLVSELPEGYNTDFIQIDSVMVNYLNSIDAYFVSTGYDSMQEVFEESIDNGNAIINNASQSSVCAHVTVMFSQKMTMTREAFEGTLTIHNGHDTDPMEAIGVNFIIKDGDGNDCTNLFQINTLSLKTVTGIDGTGSLDAGLDGVAKIQFIPTKYAAPIEPKIYYFGGTFSFIDPYTSEEIVYDLYPVEITVNPSPDLYVDYFMQRIILGDDALTTDVIERSEPAELGVIIHNQGAGMAKNVILETAEPVIVDNEKGLAINFSMYGASFNGSPRQLGLTSIPFGNIGSGQTAVGEWLFTSSLLGHFVSYQANVIHNSSYGNPDLSLVSHLAIHELNHAIYAYGSLDDGINDFLVNDNPDAYDLPDSIYFSHGGRTAVGLVEEINFDHAVTSQDTIVTLTLMPSRVGWNYGATDDPGNDLYEIVSCIRNYDNQVIPLNNVWQTFVTIPDGGDPMYENKLHIVDTLSVQQTTTYTLVFRRKPSNLRIFNGNEDEYWSNVANWENGIKAQTDEDVLINGICLLDEDADVFSLTVAENQSLTIPAGRILTTSGTLTSEATSRLVIQDGGQLMHKNEGVQATVQKGIEPYTNNYNGYYLIATPLVGFTAPASVVNMLSNDYDLYYFDQSQELEWINYEGNNGGYDLVPGKGYLYANSEGIVLEFPGELRSGATTLTVPLIYAEGAEFMGFNLVGNPFAYNLTTYAAHNVAEGCYRMNDAKDDLIVSEISESNPLKPAEGFFVKATDAGAYITFNPQMTSMAPQGSINVELSENNLLIDRLIVKTHKGYPLEKFNLKATRTKLFAQDKHHECAIVPCESNEQPVNFKAAKNGTYTINVNVDGMEFYYLHLIDNLTGNDVNLLTEPSYTFEAHTTDYASRFLLRFIPKGDIETGSENDNFAYNFNGTWIIANEGDAILQVVDVLGHIISSERIDGCCEKHIQAAAGVYLLRLINGDDARVQKVVVR